MSLLTSSGKSKISQNMAALIVFYFLRSLWIFLGCLLEKIFQYRESYSFFFFFESYSLSSTVFFNLSAFLFFLLFYETSKSLSLPPFPSSEFWLFPHPCIHNYHPWLSSKLVIPWDTAIGKSVIALAGTVSMANGEENPSSWGWRNEWKVWE